MSVYTLDTDLVVQNGDAQWRLHRVLNAQHVVLENQATGGWREMKISKLASDIACGKLSVVRANDAGVTECHQANSNSVMCTATLAPKYKAQFERTYDYVRQMRKRGISKGQRTRIAEAIASVAITLGDTQPPKSSTVMDWMRDYEAAGQNPTVLLSRNVRRRAPRRLQSVVLTAVTKVLKRYYFIRNGCTLREAHDKVLRELERAAQNNAGAEARESVSLSTVRRIAYETTPFDRDRARLGPGQARAKWRFSKPGGYATRPLERVEMDHTILDIVVLDDVLGIPLGRPVITLAVCSFSGYILGFFISFEGETIGRVVQSIKVAVQPKDVITAGQGLATPWYAMGTWEAAVLDNSLAFHAGQVRHVASELCMDVEYCPVRMPWFKPCVERHLGELTRQLPAAGRPKKPGSGPDPIDPNKSACITFSDLCTGVLKWVVDVHPFEINERKLARPIDLFLEGLDACPAPTLIEDATSLDVIAGLHASATVDHSGLVHKWIRYTNDDLAWMRKEVGAKFKTTIKYNPYDLGSVFVLHPRSGMWVQVEARDHEYASGLTATQHKLIRNAATDKLTEKNAETVLRRTRLELQDHWARAIRGGRKLKRGSRELALFQGVSSLSRINAPQLNAGVRATALAADTDSMEPSIGSIPTFDVFMRDER